LAFTHIGIKPANLVLEDTVERIYHGNAYAENWHGLFLIRGENVVLLGEVVRCFPHHFFADGWFIIVTDFVFPLHCGFRTSIKRTRYHYGEWITAF
jgi:hypothetical protein